MTSSQKGSSSAINVHFLMGICNSLIDTHPDRHTYLTGTGERGSLFKKPLNFSLRNVLVVSIVLASVFSSFFLEDDFIDFFFLPFI